MPAVVFGGDLELTAQRHLENAPKRDVGHVKITVSSERRPFEKTAKVRAGMVGVVKLEG